MTESILLTGGFGNVGGRFSAHLTDNLVPNLRLSSRHVRPAPAWAPSAETVVCDLLDIASLKKACSGITTVFHFAALNDRDCVADPDLAHEVNVVGTNNLVEAAIECGVDHIVYMSTIHVYGSPLVGHFDETSPTLPTHPYGVSHLGAELVLASHAPRIRSTIVRSGNGFGYPLNYDVDIWHIVVNDLCQQAIRNQRMVLKSPSNIERNFITLKDICRGLQFLGLQRAAEPESAVFNLGSSRSRTLLEMATLVGERCGINFGYQPAITEAVEPTSAETTLDFNCSKLFREGFEINEDFNAEVDGILKLVRARHAN